MANRRDYYYRQKVTEAELDAGFDGLETAQRNIMGDHELHGIVDGLIVSQHAGTPDLTVDVAAGIAYSKQGERIQVPALQNVDVSIDSAAITTDVAAPGNSKIVSVFLEYDETLSDPRIDGNGATVFHQIDESFSIVVVQGAEGVSPVAPSLNSNRILLADITRTFGDTQILNAVISPDPTDLTDATGRREDLIHVDDTPVALREVVLRGALTSLLAALNAHLDGSVNRHGADDIDAIAQSSGGESVTLGTVESQILELLASLDTKLGSLAAVDEDILPDASGTRDLGSATLRWNAYLEELRTYATAILGVGMISTAGDANTPRLSMTSAANAESTRTLLFEGTPGSGVKKVRIYAVNLSGGNGLDEGIEFTVNASFDGSQWSADDTGQRASRLTYNGSSFKASAKISPVSPWGDIGSPAWDQRSFNFAPDGSTTLFEFFDGRLSLTDASETNILNTNTPATNTIYAKNTVKAWAHIKLDTNGNVSFFDAFNVQLPSNPGTSQDLNITFRNALTDANYAVIVQSFGTTTSHDSIESPRNFTTSGFTTTRFFSAGAQTRDQADGTFGHVAFVVLGTDS